MSTETTAILTGTAENFEPDVLRSEIPVLVDFSAGWCPPCKLLKPVLEGLAGELEGQVRIVVVDIDDAPGLAERYGVTSIPDLRVFENGEIVVKAAGFRPREDLLELLAPFLTTPPAK